MVWPEKRIAVSQLSRSYSVHSISGHPVYVWLQPRREDYQQRMWAAFQRLNRNLSRFASQLAPRPVVTTSNSTYCVRFDGKEIARVVGQHSVEWSALGMEIVQNPGIRESMLYDNIS